MTELLQPDLSVANDDSLIELLVSELGDVLAFRTDAAGFVTDWNPAVERILGYRKAEWVGKRVHLIFTPDDRAAKKPERDMATAAREGRAPAAGPYQKKDGSLLFVQGATLALKDSDGKLLGFYNVMRAPGDGYEAELAMRRKEETYRNLFNGIDQGFCILEIKIEPGEPLDYRVIEVNPAFEKQSPQGNAEGRWMRELYPHHEERWFELYSGVALTGEPIRFQERSQELGVLWFDVYAFRIGQPEQKQVGVIFTNVTEGKHAEQALRDSEERLQRVFAEAPVAIVVFRGPEFVIEMANPYYAALVQGRELVGRRFADVVPEIGADVWAAFHQVMDTGEPFVRDEFYVPYDQDGDGIVEDHWFNLVYHPLRESDGTVSGLVTVCIEVTAHIRARKDLELVNRGLEEFAHVASHDLQEPLRMVRCYTQLLIESSGDDATQLVTEERRLFAGFIENGVKRMEALIRDLLAYSRTVHSLDLDVGNASLETALGYALAAVEARATETGAVITHEPLPVVLGDEAQLSHVFQNLLSNALKYCTPGQQPQVHISAELHAGEWVVSVRDNGIGFESKHAARIFGLFKRLHRDDEYPGTGLGLAICKRIVEQYGGRIWADSEPLAGATFRFSLAAGRQ
ncbi:MAG: multi-sensor signal transduction histidine kinase [Bryobacterales bacterium]|nr:multi-sensor signal transduction histidine kinase [Bryobacterales bacterium]